MANAELLTDDDANGVRHPDPVNIQDTALLGEIAARAEDSPGARREHPATPAGLARALNRYDENKKKFRGDMVLRALRSMVDQGVAMLLEPDNTAQITDKGLAIWRAMSGVDLQPGPGGIMGIPHHLIGPDPDNPRTLFDEGEINDLAEDIAERGLLQNVIVRKHPKNDGYFMLVGGERRWRSIGKLIEDQDPRWPWDRPIPSLVRDYADSNGPAVDALVENIKRVQLNPIEEAKAFRKLRDEGLSTSEIAEKLGGRTQRYVQQRLKLLELSTSDQAAVSEGRLSVEAAREKLTQSKPQSDKVKAKAPEDLPTRANTEPKDWQARIISTADAVKTHAQSDKPTSASFWATLFNAAAMADLGRGAYMSDDAVKDVIAALHSPEATANSMLEGQVAGWIKAMPNARSLSYAATKAHTEPATETHGESEDTPAAHYAAALRDFQHAVSALKNIVVIEAADPTAHNALLTLAERARDGAQAAVKREQKGGGK